MVRLIPMLVLLVAIIGGGDRGGAAAPPTSDWLQTTASPLPATGLRFGALVPAADGRVLSLVHGYNATSYFYQTSLYDPTTEGWAPAQALAIDQGNGAPVALADGRVLLSGGDRGLSCAPNCSTALATAQVFDPAQNRWSSVAPMSLPRLGHCAARLRDGTVLVVGGYIKTGSHLSEPVTRTVRYDPRADRWTEVASAREHYSCAALTLVDGRVLVLGLKTGGGANAELYDPATDRWAALDLPMGVFGAANYGAFAPVHLPDGRVLVVVRNLVPTAGIFDPTTNRWSDAPAPAGSERASTPATVTPLDDGRILATGPTTELYDPAEGRWVPIAMPGVARVWDTFPSNDDSVRLSWAAAPIPGGRAILVAADTALVLGDPARPRACFAETGQCLNGRFLAYWQANGGLAANGFPLTGPLTEELEDGRSYTVQYFERVRFEYHPENPPPHDFLLGQFGRRLHPADPPAAPLPGRRYFPQTGHNLGAGFLAHWEANGGVPRLGYPLTEVITERLEDGNLYEVQYFERARLEYHHENPAPFDILAGQFGRRILQENLWLAQEPRFKRRYIADPRLQAALGQLRGPLLRGDLEFQAFERGAMLLPLDDGFNAAYVLCDGTPAAGTSAATVSRRDQPPPQPPPAPPPGRYLPINGIGDLWLRNASVRECLGYATTPVAVGTPLAARGVFVRGLLVAVATPDGPALYAIYGEPDGRGFLNGGSYERLSATYP